MGLKSKYVRDSNNYLLTYYFIRIGCGCCAITTLDYALIYVG